MTPFCSSISGGLHWTRMEESDRAVAITPVGGPLGATV